MPIISLVVFSGDCKSTRLETIDKRKPTTFQQALIKLYAVYRTIHLFSSFSHGMRQLWHSARHCAHFLDICLPARALFVEIHFKRQKKNKRWCTHTKTLQLQFDYDKHSHFLIDFRLVAIPLQINLQTNKRIIEFGRTFCKQPKLREGGRGGVIRVGVQKIANEILIVTSRTQNFDWK